MNLFQHLSMSMLWKMRVFVVVVLLLVSRLNAAITSSQVNSLVDIYLPPTGLPNQLMPIRKEQLHDVHLFRFVLPPKPTQLWIPKASYEASPGPAPSQSLANSGPAAAPFSNFLRRHHHHHHHHRHRQRRPYVALSPGPAIAPGCGQTCLDPLTSKPIGSPCGCVVPMKVRLLLNVAVYDVFAEINELAIELAAGTYIKHSQVQIVGANADSQSQGRAVLDINLVPLGNKFDNTTATLISDRFWKKDVPLNKTLFGSYEVVSITYPGIPPPPPLGYVGTGPSGSIGDGRNPFSADVRRNKYKMSTRTVLLIVFSAIVVCLSFFAAVYIIINCRRGRKPSNAVGPVLTPSINKKTGIGYTLSSSVASSRSMSLFSSIHTCALSMKTFSLAEMEKATEKFSPRRILGEGGFGRVYRGILEDGTEAAVKLLTRDNQNGDREFIAEVEILSRLHHRNLVKLIGICIEAQRHCLVYELVHNGSVESHLHGPDREKGALDWDARMKIAIGAARGLAYLHEDSNPRVIHRDFKASNVLLEDDFTPKVSDFGLAREATEGSHHVSTRVMGTFGYVAPEYAMTGHLLVKSDVYSYGVVLLELLTGRKPVDMSQSPGHESLVTWARPLLTSREGLQQLVDPSLAGTCNFDSIAKVASIASMCVHPEVTHRPFMGEVVQALKLIYNNTDETGGDCASQMGSSVPDLDSDIGPSDSSWWNAGGLSPSFTYGQGSAFITMDYSSGPLQGTENRPFSASSLGETRIALPIQHGNRSGPLRTSRNKPFLNRLKGSMSEHGNHLLPRQPRNNGFWV